MTAVKTSSGSHSRRFCMRLLPLSAGALYGFSSIPAILSAGVRSGIGGKDSRGPLLG
jgi:hypothetical protein